MRNLPLLTIAMLAMVLAAGVADANAQRPRWAVHSYSFTHPAVQTIVADLNGDGKPDVIQLTAPDYQTIRVLLGNGNGTFQAPKYTTLSYFVHQIAVSDINRDGKPDLVAVGDVEFSVSLGNGDGTFRSAIDTMVMQWVLSMAVGDVNNDGYPDVIAGNGVYLGNGKGSFAFKGAFFNWYYEEPIWVDYLLRRFSNVAYNDVVVVEPHIQDIIRSFRNTGGGTFMLVQTIPPAAGAIGPIYVADLNNDGKLDILINCQGTGVMLMLGNGDATFKTPQVIYTPGWPGLGYVNADKRLDLVIATHNPGPGTYVLYTYLNNGTGYFSSPKINTTLKCNDFLMGDLNGDGLSDLLCDTATGTQVALSNGDGTYTTGVATSNNLSTLIALTDITRDGASDAILLSNDGTTMYTLANLSGTIVTPSTSPSVLVYRQPFYVKATVVPSLTPNASTPPGGTVTVKDGSTLLGSAAVGTSLYVSGGFSVGTHTLSFTYGGDYNFNPHTVSLTRTVSKAASYTSVTSSANPSSHGQPVTFSAKVSPQYGGVPAGKVTFKDGSTVLATIALSSGRAAWTTASLSVGTHSISVTYSGDTNFRSSASPVLYQKVN